MNEIVFDAIYRLNDAVYAVLGPGALLIVFFLGGLCRDLLCDLGHLRQRRQRERSAKQRRPRRVSRTRGLA